jgi:hypothetical protein
MKYRRNHLFKKSFFTLKEREREGGRGRKIERERETRILVFGLVKLISVRFCNFEANNKYFSCSVRNAVVILGSMLIVYVFWWVGLV